MPAFTRSLRFRLLIASLAVEALVLLFLLGNSFRLIDERLTSQNENFQAKLELAYQVALATPMANRDYASLHEILDGWRSAEDVTYLALIDNTGKRIVSMGWPEQRVLPIPGRDPDKLTLLHNRMPIEVYGQQYGYLHYGLSLQFLETARRDLLIQGLGIAAIGILLTAVILFGISYWLTRHLATLASASTRIAAGDYRIELPTQDPGEIGQLSRNFAQMAVAIETRIGDLATLLVELEKARDAAQAANIAKSQFLATMSHELRTPMNGVLGMAQLLVAGPTNEAETKDYARIILHSGQTLLTLLNDILDLSKVESGKLTLEVGVVAPTNLLHDTEALFTSNAQAKGLALCTRWSGPTNRRYRGDPHRLQQMLSNLTNNAIKFTSAGEVCIEATEIAVEAGIVLFEVAVRDTGIGIPSDKQALLFQPFTQADNSTTRQFGGTGLGLSIVKSLAQLMDGEVGVESREGHGSRFWFRVRLEALTTEADTRTQQRDNATSGRSIPPGRQLAGRVLVVEDNRTNQLVVGALLKKLGVEMAVVDNGQMAVEKIMAGNERFDLILMDIQMPVLDGYGATTQIRAWEVTHSRAPLPIIALTADAFAEDQARCREVGMNDYLSKPINVNGLATALASWLPGA